MTLVRHPMYIYATRTPRKKFPKTWWRQHQISPMVTDITRSICQLSCDWLPKNPCPTLKRNFRHRIELDGPLFHPSKHNKVQKSNKRKLQVQAPKQHYIWVVLCGVLERQPVCWLLESRRKNLRILVGLLAQLKHGPLREEAPRKGITLSSSPLDSKLNITIILTKWTLGQVPPHNSRFNLNFIPIQMKKNDNKRLLITIMASKYDQSETKQPHLKGFWVGRTEHLPRYGMRLPH